MADAGIADLVRTDHATLAPADPVRAAAARLAASALSAAPVLDGAGRLVGILTQKDCFRPALDASYYQQWSGTVSDVMTRDPATLDAGLELVEAAQMFLEQPFRSYPVTAGSEFKGMLERGDVLAALMALG